ncbi:DUF3489 domain-containing protein [Lichenihabitans sp. PAMC28606]|uniref:DUF3489 domain-containing protein n=1 Tax=Lichenihabitans sp. PAMC28606 TaxID=2880932 RepID=UPI001D0B24C8|nr:DUF3489 domain-containing protein [Lichenihabitans sp. PAMC28606]UDL93139.1 DUF3489 domain-containing protein [Lichenihabitans sp. PAMC28606]
MTLSDTQLVLLSAAAQRDNHLLVCPERLSGSALERLVTRLTSSGLAEHVAVKPDQPRWPVTEVGEAVGLRITAAGLAALGIAEDALDPPEHGCEPAMSGADGFDADRGAGQDLTSPTPLLVPGIPLPRPGTKQAMLVDMLRQKEGASVESIMVVTGWLPHTVRAALTGLRKKGHHLDKDRTASGITSYRLQTPVPVARMSPADGAA